MMVKIRRPRLHVKTAVFSAGVSFCEIFHKRMVIYDNLTLVKKFTEVVYCEKIHKRQVCYV